MLLRCVFGAKLQPQFVARSFARKASTHRMATYSGPVGTIPNDAKSGEKGEPMKPIPSASLIVLCPISSQEKGSSSKYGILMQQKSARDGSSFQMAVVFPGGALDLADLEAVKRSGSHSSKEEEYDHALRLCALREAFEETGLLLIPTDSPFLMHSRAFGPAEAGIQSAEWAKIREEVHNDARAFPSFLSRVTKSIQAKRKISKDSTLPPLAPIRHHSIWITPRAVVRPAKRFDAHFYLTILDKTDALGPLSSSKANGEKGAGALALSADGTETTSIRLATAEEMIDLAIRDEIVLFPPQFYILADLAASLRDSKSKQPNIPSLVFRHPGETSLLKTKKVTPVEEEARGTQDDQYPQFSRSSSSIQASQRVQGITSVEPHAVPSSGANVSKSTLAWRGQNEEKDSRIASRKEAEEDEDIPFVFPLVLPGDFLASQDQRDKMGGSYRLNVNNAGIKPINRLYVTPRSRKEGGGLIVRGARRRGLPGLIDFEEGAKLEEMGAEDEEAALNHEEPKLKPRQTKL